MKANNVWNGTTWRARARAAALGLVLLAALGAAWANTYPIPANSSSYSHLNWKMVGNQAIMMPSGGGTPTTMTVPSGSANATFGNSTITHPNGGWPGANGTSKVPVPGGNGRAAETLTRLPYHPTSTGMALARFAAKWTGPLSAGIAIFDLLQELDVNARRDPVTGGTEFYQSETVTIYRLDENKCRGSTSQHQPQTDGTLQALALVCGGYQAEIDPGSQCGPIGAGTIRCMRPTFGNVDISVSPIGTTDVEYPYTEAQLRDNIASKSGWPTSSAISRAIKDALDGGTEFKVNAPTTSGPATVTLPPTTTTETTPEGVVTHVTNNTISVTYNGDTLTFNTTNITTTTNPDGTTKTTTTTSEPKEDDDQCKKNPESVGCAEMDTPEGEIPKSTKVLTYAAESLGFGSGSCPADVTASVGGQSMTVFRYTPHCAIITTYVKPLVLMLSAFIAFFIVMPGGKPE